MNTKRSNVTKVRQVITCHKELSSKSRKDNPYDTYRVDRRCADQYFKILPKNWKSYVLDFFSELRDKRETIAYLDVCGRASGTKIGADISFLFSFHTDSLTKRLGEKQDVFIDGDIFDPLSFSQVIEEVKNCNSCLALVIFRPMAGLECYTPWHKEVEPEGYEEITYSILAKRLKQVVSVLEPGGYVMLERPFQFDRTLKDALIGLPQNNYEISMAIKKIARKLKCTVKIHAEITGPYYLLRKSI